MHTLGRCGRITHQGEGRTEVECVVPVGAVGDDLAIAMEVCREGYECIVVPARLGGTFDIALPNITAVTLRFFPGLTGAARLSAVEQFDEVVAFNGTGFLGGEFKALVPEWGVSYTNGEGDTFVCELMDDSTHAVTVCRTSPGSGSNHSFSISWEGVVLVTGTDTYEYPDNPVIEGVTGCPSSDPDTAEPTGCPTAGLLDITLTGKFFGANPIVTIGGKRCIDARVSEAGGEIGEIVCQLPSGTGLNVPVLIANGDNGYLSAPTQLSYALPVITSVTGCPTSSGALHATVHYENVEM